MHIEYKGKAEMLAGVSMRGEPKLGGEFAASKIPI
jgi:hypothetical protein